MCAVKNDTGKKKGHAGKGDKNKWMFNTYSKNLNKKCKVKKIDNEDKKNTELICDNEEKVNEWIEMHE